MGYNNNRPDQQILNHWDQDGIPLGGPTSGIVDVANSALRTTLATKLAGEDQTNDVLAIVRKPLNIATYAWSSNKTSTYVLSAAIQASATIVRDIVGYNSKLTPQWIGVFNASAAPAASAVPERLVYAAPTANFSIDLGEDGLYFSLGAVVANSTTAPYLTAGTADIFFGYRYK